MPRLAQCEPAPASGTHLGCLEATIPAEWFPTIRASSGRIVFRLHPNPCRADACPACHERYQWLLY